MTLEWLRRRDPALDRSLRTYLFTTEPITEIEAEIPRPGRAPGRPGRRLRIARHRQPERERLVDHLHRELAPVSDDGWEALEQEAKSRLTTHLAARRIVDFSGPHGWSHSATNLGRISVISGPSEGVPPPTVASSSSSSCGRSSACRVSSSTTPSAGPRTSTSPSSTKPHGRSPSGRTSPCSTATRPPGCAA